jgi:hypothetical protein
LSSLQVKIPIKNVVECAFSGSWYKSSITFHTVLLHNTTTLDPFSSTACDAGRDI